MAQFARPDSNVTQTSFTGGFAEIGEATASDADFASGADNTAAELEVGLSNVTDPAISTGHVFRYRIAKTKAGVVDGTQLAVTVTARLMQGIVQIGTDTAKTADGIWTQYAYTLSEVEASLITDYTDLRLEFLTSASGGTAAKARGGAVSWAELEVPSVAAVDTTVTPGTASLRTATFAPSVTTTLNQTATPGTAALITAAFAPTVTATAHQTVTPSTASLTLAAFAPTVTGGAGTTVVPGTASLAVSTFAPIVTASDHKTLTPATASLTTTGFAPTVTANANQTVTPGAAALSLMPLAPTVSATAHETVTVGTASLTLATFAPTATGGAGLTVVPGKASLSTSGFAPTVTSTQHQTAIPSTATLVLAGFAPLVIVPGHRVYTVGPASLVLTALAPTVMTGGVPIPGFSVGSVLSYSGANGLEPLASVTVSTARLGTVSSATASGEVE